LCSSNKISQTQAEVSKRPSTSSEASSSEAPSATFSHQKEQKGQNKKRDDSPANDITMGNATSTTHQACCGANRKAG
ncbi:unnamed protein product, partial [Amoebophrya sp. A25]